MVPLIEVNSLEASPPPQVEREHWLDKWEP